MKIQFLGAAQTVTGSCYMIEVNDVRFGIDCGLHQGNTAIETRNLDTESYLASQVDFFLITHAHMDHSGLLPRMVKEGFKGPIYCTEPTKALLGIMLLDSANIQEMEAEWKTHKQNRKGTLKKVEPLYIKEDAEKTIGMLSGVSYDTSFEPAPGIRVTYKNAGHILGAAFLELIITNNGETTRLIFSGDLGRPAALIVSDPDIPDIQADYFFMESTYGDRDHKNESNSLDELSEAIMYSYKNGEKVIIPAFAVERTQEILYSLFLLSKQGKLPSMPIFVDSPLAIKATEIFRRYPQYYDDTMKALIAKGENPFDLPNLRYTPSTQDSQSINDVHGPAIVISASGMCNAGRIKHHLRHNIWKPGASIVFVGYQAVGTPGRKIVDGASSIRILGEEAAVKAKIFTIGGFSGHAGQSQIMDWMGKYREQFPNREMSIVLIHGENKAQKTLAKLMKERFEIDPIIPGYMEEMTLTPGKAAQLHINPEKAAPKIDWDLLVLDTEAKVSMLRQRTASFSRHDWAMQAELRDKLLEINSELLRFMSQA